MRILELFSGIGGAYVGMQRVYPNSEFVRVDNDPSVKPDIVADALSFPDDFYRSFDFIWASPPCQCFSIASRANITLVNKSYPNLLDPTIRLLDRFNIDYCIENVVSAKTIRTHSLILNGFNFESTADLRRPRKFWTSFEIQPPPVYPKKEPYFRLISGGGGWIREENCRRMTLDDVKKRWDINGTMKQVAQIVLPEYSEYIMNVYKNLKEKTKIISSALIVSNEDCYWE